MDEDKTIEMGDYCESVLSHPYFQEVTSEFEKSAFKDFCDSPPADKATREDIYAQVNGARALFGFMLNFVQRKNEILLARQEELDAIHSAIHGEARLPLDDDALDFEF